MIQHIKVSCSLPLHPILAISMYVVSYSNAVFPKLTDPAK